MFKLCFLVHLFVSLSLCVYVFIIRRQRHLFTFLFVQVIVKRGSNCQTFRFVVHLLLFAYFVLIVVLFALEVVIFILFLLFPSFLVHFMVLFAFLNFLLNFFLHFLFLSPSFLISLLLYIPLPFPHLPLLILHSFPLPFQILLPHRKNGSNFLNFYNLMDFL